MMLRSMQTTDPLEAWARSHSELVKLDARARISSEEITRVLGQHCQGQKVLKDTIHWALGNNLLRKYWEKIPTEYALTDLGRAWKRPGGQSMNIEFKAGHSLDPADISNIVFDAVVDGKTVHIYVNSDALQDIAPDHTFDSPAAQFAANRYYFEEIATSLIKLGEIRGATLQIHGHHVR